MSDMSDGNAEHSSRPTPAIERAPAPASDPAAPSFTIDTMPQRAATGTSSTRLILLGLRLLFIVLLITVTLLPFVGRLTDQGPEPPVPSYIWPLVGVVLFGAFIIYIDLATPNKRLAVIFAVYLGVAAGLIGALAIGALVDLVAVSWDLSSDSAVAWRTLIKLAIGIALCYLAVSIVLTTRDDFRIVIPYVEFAKQVRGVRPLLLDTSSLIDGRVEQLATTGFLEAPLILPQFVVDELQTLSDSGDRLKRARGRRGLGIVSKLQQNPLVDISIDATPAVGRSVDHKLLHLAAQENFRILTTDYNLNKVAEIQNVAVLNLNDISNALKTHAVAGESMLVHIVKVGESPDQGVGYMPDGTMVVVENAAREVGGDVRVVVTNSLQTSAGRMIFAKPVDEDGGGAMQERDENNESHAARIADAATHQPRMTDRPQHRTTRSSGRNPRR